MHLIKTAMEEVKSIWPISAGLHTCYKGSDKGMLQRKLTQISKTYLSSNRVLQLARVKLKPLVIAHQYVAVKENQALHTPPITLGESGWCEVLKSFKNNLIQSVWRVIWAKLTQGSRRGTCCWSTRFLFFVILCYEHKQIDRLFH